MPISEVVGGSFDLPAFVLNEPTGFLPFEVSKIGARGETGLTTEKTVQRAGRHSQVVAERGHGRVDREVVHHPGVGQLPSQVASGGCRARGAEDFDFYELAQCVEGEWQGAVRDGDFLAAAGVQFLERIERGVAKVECARCALGNMEFGELGTILPDPNKDANRLAPFLGDAKAAVGVDQYGARSLNDLLLVADG